MIRINVASDEHFQRYVVLTDDGEVTLELAYYSTVERWFLNVSWSDRSAAGMATACGVLHMASRNMPYDIFVEDVNSIGLDPWRADAWSSGAYALYLLEASEMEEVRGAPVQTT